MNSLFIYLFIGGSILNDIWPLAFLSASLAIIFPIGRLNGIAKLFSFSFKLKNFGEAA